MLWALVGIGIVVGFAAVLLWFVEGIAKLIGSRRTWMLFLVGLPLVCSVGISVWQWERLIWWERIVYPLSGPSVMILLLFGGFVAINPPDAILLVYTLLQRGWRLMMGWLGAAPRA